MAATGGQYRLNIIWASHGGQVLANMGMIQGGLRGIGGAGQQGARGLDVFNRQMQAIGTTFRYMISGGAIYGTMTAFRQFAEFQRGLGDITAISPDLTRNQITGIGNTLLQQSTQLAIPVTELEESARNIQSTLQGLEPEDITRFTKEFGRGAQIAETDAYNFGNAIMGMRNAFGLGLGDMERISGEFFTVIQQSAGMTGDEWSKFSGRVVAGARVAGATLEQMNALMIIGTRQGGTAATNARHMAQLLQNLRNPTEESKKIWAEIGLDEQQLRTMPFMDILRRLQSAVAQRGGLDLEKMSDDQLSAAYEAFGDTATPEQLGMKGGGASLLMDLFGRMESRRMAGVILSQMALKAGDPALEGQKPFDDLLLNLQDAEEQILVNERAFKRWLDRNAIQQAGIALRNAMTEAIVPFEDQIKRAAQGITSGAEKWGPEAVTAGAAGVLGFGLYKTLSGGASMVKNLRGFMRGAGAGGMAAAQMASGAPPTGSFANPLWVMIHPFSGGAAGPGTGTTVLGDPTSGKDRAKGRLSKFGKFVPLLTRGGLIAGFVLVANEMAESEGYHPVKRAGETIQGSRWGIPGFTEGGGFRWGALGRVGNAASWLNKRWGVFDPNAGPPLPVNKPSFRDMSHLTRSGPRGEAIGAAIAAMSGLQSKMFMTAPNVGKSEAKVVIDLVIPADSPATFKNGAKRKRVHVPKSHDAWTGGNVPEFRGTPGNHGGPQ